MERGKVVAVSLSLVVGAVFAACGSSGGATGEPSPDGGTGNDGGSSPDARVSVDAGGGQDGSNGSDAGGDARMAIDSGGGQDAGGGADAGNDASPPPADGGVDADAGGIGDGAVADASCSVGDAGGTPCGASCCTSVQACAVGSCVDVAASLSGLRWELPCLSPGTAANLCNAGGLITKTTTLMGTSGKSYTVKLHFRGVVEPKTYTGGTNDGAYFQTGGSPASDTYNVYELGVSDPPQTYYLNLGAEGITVTSIDYEASILVNAGATITLAADPVDGVEINNENDVVVPGVPPDPQPYNGQFVQMDVVSVVAN